MSVGYVGLFFIVFAESGLFFGFFLPGDSLLVAAGLLASQGILNIFSLMVLFPLAAIMGDSFGYFTGSVFGKRLYKLRDGKIFKRKYLFKSKKFYEKHGGAAIFLARFLPFVRTFAPIVAGISKMDYKKFVLFNIFGGLVWSLGFVLLGFFLGNIIPNVEDYLVHIIAVVVTVSFIPALVERVRK